MYSRARVCVCVGGRGGAQAYFTHCIQSKGPEYNVILSVMMYAQTRDAKGWSVIITVERIYRIRYVRCTGYFFFFFFVFLKGYAITYDFECKVLRISLYLFPIIGYLFLFAETEYKVAIFLE